MATRRDFLEWLSPDMSKKVLRHLDDPADLVRASVVSRPWRRFVIVNGFSKELITRLHPEALKFLLVSEEKQSNERSQSHEINCSGWEKLEKEHRVYALFLQILNAPASSMNCIKNSISASSTDNFPDESIENTLESRATVNGRPSYWSSGGQKDPSIPEMLTYRLNSKLCVVEQINIHPFQAYFQEGHPIYSSKAVRFQMGHCLLPEEAFDCNEHVRGQDSATDEYFWTYVSPTYPMEQENVLQSFKLPKPVLCIGGFFQIELLGRVQKQEMDGLYYICVRHVQVIGRPLSPTFDVEFINTLRQFTLRYFPDGKSWTHGCNRSESGSSGQNDSEVGESSGWHSLAESIRQLRGRRWNEIVLTTLIGGGAIDVDDGEDEDDMSEGDEGDDGYLDGEQFP